MLVAGVGNPGVTADALGPATAAKVFVTRHICEAGQLPPGTRLRPVAAFAPGVEGTTGMAVSYTHLDVYKRQYKEYVADERYAKIARRVGLCDASTPTDKAVDCLIEAIVKLMKATDRPLSVQACGVSEAEFMSKVNELSYKAFEDQCTTANPVYPLAVSYTHLDVYKRQA